MHGSWRQNTCATYPFSLCFACASDSFLAHTAYSMQSCHCTNCHCDTLWRCNCGKKSETRQRKKREMMGASLQMKRRRVQHNRPMLRNALVHGRGSVSLVKGAAAGAAVEGLLEQGKGKRCASSSVSEIHLRPSIAQEAMYRARAWFVNSFVLPQVPVVLDRSFSHQDFLEGSKDAYIAVHECFADGDLESLRPLVSQRVLNAFSETLRSYREAGLSMELSLESLDDAYITGFRLAGDEDIGDEQLVDPSNHQEVSVHGRRLARTGQVWAYISVRYRTRERCRLYRCAMLHFHSIVVCNFRMKLSASPVLSFVTLQHC